MAQGPEDVTTLIAKKSYAKAIEVLKQQLKGKAPDPRVRLQLADVLVLTGKGREAVMILSPLADEFAREGFAAKAISVLKKIQKIDPGRRDVETRLASLIEEKQRQATVALPPPPKPLEIGIEEIGFDLPMGAPAAVPARHELPVSAPEPSGPELSLASEPLDLPAPDEAAVPEISLEPEPAPPPAPRAPRPSPGAGRAPVAPAGPPVVAAPAPVVDRDLFTEEDLEGDEGLVLSNEEIEGEAEIEAEPMVEAELVPLEAADESVEPMSDSRFGDELMSLVDDVFQSLTAGSEGGQATTPEQAGAPSGGTQIVVSPLFKDFSVDELVAVIEGLKLLTFDRGQVIIREGDAGHSLYMLTAGTVRAFKKNSAGKQMKVADLSEGAFFGEVSILTGKPRSATVAALSRCELLELDRASLDSIAKTHPHVWDVMGEFCNQRMGQDRARGA